MAPKPQRSSDTPAHSRIATAIYQPDAHATVSNSAFGRAPSYSPAELAGFRDFAKVMRDAIGEKGMKGSVKELTPDEAAERGCLGTLKSLHRRGHVTFNEDLCIFAAQGGQFLVLKWLRENSCPWNADTCTYAARGRAPRGAAVGAQERLPLERVDVHESGGGRAPRGAAVGARERLPVGRRNVLDCGKGRAPRGAAVGARERMPVG